MVRTYRYHATKPPVVVETPEQEAALGPGWFDTPDAALAYAAESHDGDQKPPAPVGDTLDGLSAADAAKAVLATDDLDTLQAWLDAELSQPKPRARVTRVLGERLEFLTAPTNTATS